MSADSDHNENFSADWLIVGGAPRSGTTFLFQLIKAHPAIALSNERQLFRRLARYGEGQVVQEYFSVLTPQQQATVKWIGEKVPEYYEHLLHRMFRQKAPYIVHISRRPRDVVASMLHRTRMAGEGRDADWSPYFHVRDAIDTWLRAWRFAIDQKDNPRFLHVRYEDALADPRWVLDRVSSHLGIEPGPLNPSWIEPPGRRELDPDAEAFLNQSLGEIDLHWDCALPELEARFGHLQPRRMSGPRRLWRRVLWAVSTRRNA